MEHMRISALRPDLHAIESKQIRAVVTLIWPYSSSQRQFALLLAEPDFRLRRNKGQVRARFASSSARALATTGVGIGDEVVLSLHGAQFVQDGAVSTPGKSIDWELVYTQTFTISVRRDGAEIANLDIVNAVPTPAPRSPVKKPASAPSPIPQWSSPAFLKRARLSNGPFFEQPAFDPLADEGYDGHDKKRRRKSYRDWTAWTYTARTPSPDKEDPELEHELEEALSSPSRRPQLPKTPISPSRTELAPVAAPPAYDIDYVEESTIADSAEGDTTVDDGELHIVRVPRRKEPARRPEDGVLGDGSDDSVYHGPNDSQHDFGGDTELNTEDEDEEEGNATVPDIESVNASTTGIATELEDESDADEDPAASVFASDVEVEAEVHVGVSSGTEEDSDIEDGDVGEGDIEPSETRQSEQDLVGGEDTTIDETVPEIVESVPQVAEPAIAVNDEIVAVDETVPETDEPVIVVDESVKFDDTVEIDEPAMVIDESIAAAMPPPNLPSLQTNFPVLASTDLLTPIGREPSSPNLKAVDSATLPQPSPFPGEQTVSYFEHTSVSHQQVPLDGPPVQLEAEAEVEAESDADYIMESSFFSSINSSRAVGLHQDHETAFTPVRFTFGGDGTGWSRPLELSSPSPDEAQPATTNDNDAQLASTVSGLVESDSHDEQALIEQLPGSKSPTGSSLIEHDGEEVVSATETFGKPTLDIVQPTAEVVVGRPASRQPSNVSMSSPHVEPEESEVEGSEHEEGVAAIELSDDEPEEPIEKLSSDGEEVSESEADETTALETSGTNDEISAEVNKTTDIDAEAKEDQPENQDHIPANTQSSAVASEIVDLGSPSVVENSEAEHDDDVLVQPDPLDAATGGHDIEAEGPIRKTDRLQQNDFDLGVTSSKKVSSTVAPEHFSFDEFINQDVEQRDMDVRSPRVEQQIQQQGASPVPDTSEKRPAIASDDVRDPQAEMDEPLLVVELDDEMQIDSSIDVKGLQHDLSKPEAATSDIHIDTAQPDMKTESIEDESMSLVSPPGTQDTPQESGTDPATELLIVVPKDINKLDELHLKSVPATAPARNTRSKAKLAASLPEEETSASQLSTSARRTRSKASFDSTNRETTSPTQSRPPARPTATPPRDVTQTSPYSLRSQSKNISPSISVASPSPRSATTRRSPRKLVQSDDDFSIASSQAENRDLFGSVSKPSQDLGLGYTQVSQSQQPSDAGHVKHPEEVMPHSEGSVVSLQSSDPAESTGNVRPTTPRMEPPPASSSRAQRQTRSRSRSIDQQSTVVSPSQPPQSQRRSPRLTRSTFAATPSPRIVRTTREAARISSLESGATGSQQNEEATLTAKEKPFTYPGLPTEDERDIRSSPPAPAQQPHPHESNLITPAATQQTTIEPPLSFQAHQPDESLITPELTQSTSASATLRSFDIPLPGVQTQPAPRSPALRTSPRHKPTLPDPKPSSPIPHSSSPTSATQHPAPTPTIGLSTPLAYYTPLRDLPFFLNRSSAFHTSTTTPDILAVVTSATTPPSRSKSGPRDFSTTLALTDASIFPATRTATVFRPFAAALPEAEAGDVILLRAFAVRSEKRVPVLRSAEESAWCVWRFGRRVWGRKRGVFGEVRAREEVRGPEVERGEGEAE